MVLELHGPCLMVLERVNSDYSAFTETHSKFRPTIFDRAKWLFGRLTRLKAHFAVDYELANL